MMQRIHFCMPMNAPRLSEPPPERCRGRESAALAGGTKALSARLFGAMAVTDWPSVLLVRAYIAFNAFGFPKPKSRHADWANVGLWTPS